MQEAELPARQCPQVRSFLGSSLLVRRLFRTTQSLILSRFMCGLPGKHTHQGPGIYGTDLRIYQYRVVPKIFWSRKASHSQAMPWKRLPSIVPEKSTSHHLRKKQYWVRMAKGQITCYFLYFSHSFPQRDHLHWMITQNGNTFLSDIIRWKNICLLEFQEIIWNEKWPAWLVPKKQFKRSREMTQVEKEWRNRLCLQSGCVG